jgi:hypothetical protein
MMISHNQPYMWACHTTIMPVCEHDDVKSSHVTSHATGTRNGLAWLHSESGCINTWILLDHVLTRLIDFGGCALSTSHLRAQQHSHASCTTMRAKRTAFSLLVALPSRRHGHDSHSCRPPLDKDILYSFALWTTYGNAMLVEQALHS